MSNLKEFLFGETGNVISGALPRDVGSICLSPVKADDLDGGKLVRFSDVVLDRGMYPELSDLVDSTALFEKTNQFLYRKRADNGNGIWITIEGNSIMYTTDGENFSFTNPTGASFPNDAATASVAFANGVFIAAGSFGSFWRSSDGLNWSTLAVPTGGINAASITSANNTFIASGNTMAFSQDDGSNWTQLQVFNPSSGSYIGWHPVSTIEWIGDKWFTVGTNGSAYYFATSTDLLSWTVHQTSFNITSYSQIVYFENIDTVFVVLRDNTSTNTLYKSTDGINWTSETNHFVLNHNFGYVFDENGDLLVMSLDTSNNLYTLYYTNDLINWDQITTLNYFPSNYYVMRNIYNKIYFTTNGMNGDPSDTGLFKVTYSPDIYLPEVIFEHPNGELYPYIRVSPEVQS